MAEIPTKDELSKPSESEASAENTGIVSENVVAVKSECSGDQPDSEPEEVEEEKEIGAEIGTVEILEEDRPKAEDLDFQHCKIAK